MKPFRALVVAAVTLTTVAITATVGQSQNTKLFGSVGPGFTIGLRDASSSPVSRLAPGGYELVVDDKGNEHNFRVQGPGVDVATEVDGVGQDTFPITLVDGAYSFLCDVHPDRMRGSFTVGNTTTPPASPPPPPAPPPVGPSLAPPSAPVGARLALTVGPGATISLKTGAGKAVKVLRPGGYTFAVRDRSAAHNAHLTGAGVNKKTTKAFVGTVTWKLTLKVGTLRFLSDAAKTSLKGSVKVVS
ncbi:MAG: hypothetical protein ACKVUT_06095 [Gaiella sp.]